MLRPIFAFLTLCLAAFLLAPTVASVQQKVEELNVERPLPWQLWEWEPIESPPPISGCGKKERHLYSEITKWPDRIEKDEPFSLGGVVLNEEDGRIGVAEINVDVFINETKDTEGVFLGEAVTDSAGKFTLRAKIPFDLDARRYHLVAHAKEERIDCILYLEHWSDPEMDVVSRTRIEWEDPGVLVAGRNSTLTGLLLDSVDAPVRNATVNVTLAGKLHTIRTDRQGEFEIAYTPPNPGTLAISAKFDGSKYYTASAGNTTWPVQDEGMELTSPADFTRSTPMQLAGHVYVADAKRLDTVTLTFDGFRVVACESCEPVSTVEVPLAADGAFVANLTVPPSEKGGAYGLRAEGGGLRRPYDFDANVTVPVTVALRVEPENFFGKGFEGDVTLRDETGAPVVGEVRVESVAGDLVNSTDANGVYAFSGAFAECGSWPVVAIYEGGDFLKGERARSEVVACPYMAFIPPWLLAVPWWVWPLVALAAVAAWYTFLGWRQKYATVISGGPALTLTFTEPADAAAGYAAIGEAVVATTFLEEPLPDGHRLRMGTHRSTKEVPLDAELRAHLHLVPDKLGEIPIRAEIVDGKGRIVSRRTVILHTVKYAEEIERRYLRLRKETGADESVTPREFERWLHERAPAMDAELVRRLVRIFEEADYSPRVAGRAEFVAYLQAEGGVKEVTADALA